MLFVINFFRNLIAFFYYPVVRLYVGVLSEINRFRSFGKKPKFYWEHELQGKNILLIAIYEKGALRPDIRRLMKAAKAQGMYVFGVNTLKLSDPDQYKDIMDCYIEKFNYGRDFSSYKTGFMHIYKRGWETECARVLMANDSVFYSTKGLKKFLKNMTETNVEVLGSTENFEINYHLGSFWISLSSKVLQNTKLKSYWKKYTLSDVRPTVIKRGEMGLSKCLARVVSSDGNMVALYDGANFLKAIIKDRNLVDFALQNGRTSSLSHWPRTDIGNLLGIISNRYLHSKNIKEPVKLKLTTGENYILKKHFINSIGDILTYLNELTTAESNPDISVIDTIIAAEIVDTFSSGSQIHQNAAILLNAGLPFIKLDGMYRGMFAQEDIITITKQLNSVEASELQALLMRRPFGGKVLIGWKKVAFSRGLI